MPPWMVLLSILSGIAALDHILTHKACPCANASAPPSQSTAGVMLPGIRSIVPTWPRGNGVYHGLLRSSSY